MTYYQGLRKHSYCGNKNIFMKQSYVIGIDISKSKIDCALMEASYEVQLEKVVTNSDEKIKAFILQVIKEFKIDESELLICCENTGIYNRPVERVCVNLGINLWVEHAVKIKRASTDMRGKNDKKDAIRIAEYAIRYQDRVVLYKESSKSIKELNDSLKVRETLSVQRVAIENQLREAKTHDIESYKILKNGYSKILRSINKSLEEIEQKIDSLIEKQDEIKQNAELMTTIPGIGKQNAVKFIIATNNFQSFNSAKHLACYAGVVPFQNQSGTIIKRDRVSKMANLHLKSLLHMAAMAAIRFDPEMKTYYKRKVQEGKNKMSVLNAVRNKLVHRIVAVITQKRPYVIKKEDSIKKESILLAY
jgi:transposase